MPPAAEHHHGHYDTAQAGQESDAHAQDNTCGASHPDRRGSITPATQSLTAAAQKRRERGE